MPNMWRLLKRLDGNRCDHCATVCGASENAVNAVRGGLEEEMTMAESALSGKRQLLTLSPDST